MECRICGNGGDHKIYLAKEMMFGFGDSFEYFECKQCGCLQIASIPQNMDKYYPEKYYSFIAPAAPRSVPAAIIEKIFRKQRAKYSLSGKNFIGKIVNKFKPARAIYQWLKICDVNFGSSILDIGSGNGTLVFSLFRDGFKNIIGIDPYISQDIYYNGKLRIKKSDICGLGGEYDLIMMHHSLEHMYGQSSIMAYTYKMLKAGGHALIRIPTVSSLAWKKYGVNWVQLDAPRHFFLHSLESIKMLAKKNNFKIKKIAFDSNASSFLISRQYEAGISLVDSRSYAMNAKNSIFSENDIRLAKKEAKEANARDLGDQICLILEK